MNCDTYRELLVSQLCGEIETGEESELQNHLETCEGCRIAQSEFRGIIGLMTQLPKPEWDEKLRIREMLRRNQRWHTFVFSKAAIWLISLGLIATSLTMLPIRWEASAHGFALHWGKEGIPQDQLTQQLKGLQLQLAAIQRQNQEWRDTSETRIKKLIDENNVEQQQHYWQTLQLFTNYVQLQRKADLQRIQHEIVSNYDRTGQEVEKTNELLDYVMRASATDAVYKHDQ